MKPDSITQTQSIYTGCSVVLKDGVEDPFTGYNMSGWQGRVLEIAEDEDGNALALIQWDSHTLQRIPADFIEESLDESLNWAEIAVPLVDITAAKEADTQNETDWTRARLCNQFLWNRIGKQGRRIQKILTPPENWNQISVWEVWENFLRENLIFPFDALVSYPEEIGPLKENDSITVLELAGFDEKLGLHVLIMKQDRLFALPITDLTAADPTSKIFQQIDDYTVWFTNH